MSGQRPAIALGYAAFVQLRHHPYEQYVSARLGGGEVSRQVVRHALRRTELSWPAVLAADPAAFAWRVLGETVALAPLPRYPGADSLHRTLPVRAADAVILHERLGMPAGRAAELMGLTEPELHVQLRLARRLLAERRRYATP
ncbi:MULTISPECIES: hypothetical protein [Kitasatospora]|uniref:RNA polymerase sigma factor 70 region 4 type 2 domain-containing protein n=1 Tax=Kitasatospora setae (strain ATCC 33774 / DSM 43861 / JCM 3304 / KCC A-0304 / NBRC 14216 / KM-6054) TaxID=452652 RepID=E4N7D0_KITSK|nr:MULTISPECIES: hypothetical protein [Kitasatospora]BAJ27111.1 hypothetical protein KSE_12800 [Kitasatospora setae KM-6054]